MLMNCAYLFCSRHNLLGYLEHVVKTARCSGPWANLILRKAQERPKNDRPNSLSVSAHSNLPTPPPAMATATATATAAATKLVPAALNSFLQALARGHESLLLPHIHVLDRRHFGNLCPLFRSSCVDVIVRWVCIVMQH